MFEALYAPYILSKRPVIPIFKIRHQGPEDPNQTQVAGLGFEPRAVWLQVP